MMRSCLPSKTSPLVENFADVGVIVEHPVNVMHRPLLALIGQYTLLIEFVGDLFRRLDLNEAFEHSFDHFCPLGNN